MGKQKKTLIGLGITVILILITLTTYQLIKSNQSTISGNAITELIGSGEFSYSVVIFTIQWVVIMVIIIYAYIRYISNVRKEKEKIAISKKIIKKTPSQTDFDVLYNLLKKEKSLSIRTIAVIFKIKKDIALEWAKILESNKLAVIEYPAFGDPEVIIPETEEEKKKKEEEEKKKKMSKDTKKEKTKEEKAEKKVKKGKKEMKNKVKKVKKENKEKRFMKKETSQKKELKTKKSLNKKKR